MPGLRGAVGPLRTRGENLLLLPSPAAGVRPLLALTTAACPSPITTTITLSATITLALTVTLTLTTTTATT